MFFRKAAPKAILLLGLAAVLAGCFGGGGGANPTVYIAGYRFDGTKAIPCLWTVTAPGIARTDLPHNFSESKSGYAESVFVAGTTVYIGGYYYDTNNIPIPCYWKITDGSVHLSAFGPNNSRVKSIHVYGNTVYTAGSSNDLPCCWRGDTEQTLLPRPAGAAYGEALAVFGTDENTSYAAGWYNDGSKDRPCYWIVDWRTTPPTTTRQDLLAPGDYGGEATSLVVLGNTVYTAGLYKTATGTGVPCYWVNQNNPTSLNLLSGTRYGYAEAIAVAGGTVFTAGRCGPDSIPCYWRGTSPTALPLPTGAVGGWAEGVAVSGGVVYTAGYYEDASGKSFPCYWRGTARTELPLGGALSGNAAAIYSANR